MKIARFVVVTLLVAPAAHAQACPKDVSDAVARAFPSAGIDSCVSANIDGRPVFRVQIETLDHPRRELDVSPDGHILATLDEVTLGELPHAVLRAFRDAYPHARVMHIERQTAAAGVTYELVYQLRGRLGHVTFTPTGSAPARSR
jgi:hypothetical protein